MVFLVLIGILGCFFFFSSRRRHTRCSRDWSSDVCSSDLKMRQEERDGDGYGRRRGGLEANRDPGDDRRGRTRLRGLRDLLHGSPIPRRVVLSNEDEREARDDPDYTREEEP